MAKNRNDTKLAGKLAAELSHLAHCYVSPHRPSAAETQSSKRIKKEQEICYPKP